MTVPARPETRNDLKAALAWFRAYAEQGQEPPADEASIVYQLQDDPDALMDQVDVLYEAAGL